ncbi:nitrate- and nitrite sensing domain-containing protein [Streptomyces sp. NPDC005576]|uniref:sensor histidine kinase n=1 Tax=unclassified Streptomyces TaxID=2593676 RepID=UPI0033EC7EB6
MKPSGWSLRSKITALLLLPLLSLTALWSYAAYLSLNNALTLVHVDTIGDHLARPLAQVFIDVQTERRTSLVALASPRNPKSTGEQGSRPTGEQTALSRARAKTDDDVADFLMHADTDDVHDAASTEVNHKVGSARKSLDSLLALRRHVDDRRLGTMQALDAYTQINSTISDAFEAMTVLPDQKAQRFGHSQYTNALGSDFLAQEDALISAAGAAERLTPDAYGLIVQDVGASRHLTQLALRGLPEAQRRPFEETARPGGPMEKVMVMEEQLVQAGPTTDRLPFAVSEWRKAYDAQWAVTNELALDDIDDVFELTGPPAHRALWALGLAGALGLVALIVSLVLSVRIGRSLVGDVSRLRDSARNLTEDSLRDVVGRLRRGEKVDVRTDMARPRFVHRELAALGDAFFALQTTAVDLADEDVRLHQRFSEVFVNLARRSQALVHRQLGLLESMEHREEDPQRLAELYALDQMAMHLRRHAESLIIVAGASTGRPWGRPVPIIDVLRGATAETEGYARVSVLPVPPLHVAGRAVTDVVHLLAELIENAQHFSPADTQVRVGVSRSTNGLVVEIDDRGLGMKMEDLEAANTRIREQVDVSDLDSARLGLITVGRLAQRHGIAVSLRQSPYGGVTAVVLIPHTLLDHSGAEIGDAVGHSGAAPALTGAPAPSSPGQGGAPVPYGPSERPMDAAVSHAAGPSEHAHHFPVGPVPRLSDSPTESDGHRRLGGQSSTPASSYDSWSVGRASDFASAPESATPVEEHGRPHPTEYIDGLPQRVRQASLAPQLQHSTAPPSAGLFDWTASPRAQHAPPGDALMTPPGVPGAPAPEPGATFGSPEPGSARPAQVRTLMSALQAGSARGRLARQDSGHLGPGYGEHI